ncbi:MAG: heme ABC exporter ATP-binding protein CcmA [Methylobacteriaceae bacterium]|nr:heme ABC exporter ATP-binding protein CcmA [Methylobacteriaceae bacterium]
MAGPALPPDPAPRLWAEGLALRRGGRAILAGVSFALAPGDALLVTGRNGAGKSSLLAALAGLLRPDAGRIGLDGQDEAGPAERLHLIAHRDALKAALTAGENLAVAAAICGGPGLAPEAALARLGLPGAVRLPVAYLSAGQRRRVALARLLVARRPIWLLDEPTTALDAAGQELLLGLLAEHLAGGGSVLAATHAPLPLPGARELRLDAFGPRRDVADGLPAEVW